MVVKVAAAQIPQTNEPEENYNRILKVIRETEADIICFPETALTGESKPDSSGKAWSYHSRIASAAAEAERCVIYGAYSKRGAEVFNEAWIWSLGKYGYAYGKRNLWATEDGVTAGWAAPPVIETKFGKIGVIICWDIAFPETVRSLASRGAEIIFCPSYWYAQYGTENAIAGLPLVRAFENQVFFVLADAFDPNTAKASRICSPLQTLSAAGNCEVVISAEVDLGKLADLRRTFNCWPGAER